MPPKKKTTKKKPQSHPGGVNKRTGKTNPESGYPYAQLSKNKFQSIAESMGLNLNKDTSHDLVAVRDTAKERRSGKAQIVIQRESEIPKRLRKKRKPAKKKK